MMVTPSWLWIPITLWAAFAQSLRNAAQRHLTRELGTLGATSVRFVYGLPFAAAWLALTLWWTRSGQSSSGSWHLSLASSGFWMPVVIA